jgi:hypothetical protein
VPQSDRVTELRSGPAGWPQDIQLSGRICNESVGEREDGKTPADALVCRGCPPPPPASLRRPRQSARNPLPRVASEVRTTNSSTTTNRVPPPTLIRSQSPSKMQCLPVKCNAQVTEKIRAVCLLVKHSATVALISKCSRNTRGRLGAESVPFVNYSTNRRCRLNSGLLYIGRRIFLRSSVYLGSWRRFESSGSVLISCSPVSRCL